MTVSRTPGFADVREGSGPDLDTAQVERRERE
jgi:hypothetical protein